MKFYDIDKLIRDTKQDNLYNLFVPTHKQLQISQDFPRIRVSEEQTMRLDTFCKINLQTDDYVDSICNINDIDNPLNLMAGDSLVVPTVDQMMRFKVDVVTVENARDTLQDAEKTTKVDPNRVNYVQQKYSLTPTMIDVPSDPVQVNGNQIRIGSS
jgi:hypothetical protein